MDFEYILHYDSLKNGIADDMSKDIEKHGFNNLHKLDNFLLQKYLEYLSNSCLSLVILVASQGQIYVSEDYNSIREFIDKICINHTEFFVFELNNYEDAYKIATDMTEDKDYFEAWTYDETAQLN